MFELFEIFTTGGIVLWSNTKASSHHPAIDGLISDVLISEKSAPGSSADIDDIYRIDTHTVRFSRVNNLGVIFVCVYQSILQLTYAEELVANVKAIFLSLFKSQILQSIEHGDPYPQLSDFTKFNNYFDSRVAEFEQLEAQKRKSVAQPKLEPIEKSLPTLSSPAELKKVAVISPFESSDDEDTPNTDTSTPVGFPPGAKKKSKRGGKNKNKNKSSLTGAGAAGAADSKKKPVKKMRKWGANGLAEEIDDESDDVLDFSSNKPSKNASVDNDASIDMSYGKENSQGNFVVKSLAEDMPELLDDDEDEDEEADNESSASKFSFGFLKNIVGGKTMTQDELDKTLDATRTHLMEKNVAPEVADGLCETVKTTLLGSKTKNWTSIQATVKSAMTDALRRVLTPNSSEDLLFEIRKKERENKSSVSQYNPYVISVVGVNGVGKSTNLSKIAFWLLQNRFKVLIAACDTFRSGAVEQLRVHVDRLRELTERNNAGKIDMFEEGYGKDAAVTAQHAIEYGRKNRYDVVLIDTAGRRHNDDRLMSSLEKFGKLANPDKIVMVGEALVGTDSVQQARNFNNAFGPNRNLDFFLISKCDTVGEMVGSLVNMTYSTGIPVLFVGTGQNYTDLRTLSVDWAVQLLMK
ncbi:uncharacterized protein SAPINGB_P001475 [Magnusiomyces paraingens]|uniref:Signal recognition particle receptor subunit alpha homolog n=1 Tax=Magnusiomyces paraingens TaxID=2606893 RepID=A0A5E8B653_9ASCO|nr:uncharacterized protein SAPINGB_P001475 [Saprochaete ingens]VVT46964.1 unnamed protein product [Saprochaete ingens]